MYGQGNTFPLYPGALLASETAGADVLTVMDADTEKLALRITPQGTSPITKVALCVTAAGDLTGINFVMEIQSDASDAPSGTVLGAATSEFTIAASGFIALKTLGTNTGNLTINVPVWLVLYRSSGSSLSGANAVSLRGTTVSCYRAQQSKGRHHNGTNWTTSTVVYYRLNWVVQHADDTYTGIAVAAGGTGTAPSTAADIFDTNRQGIRFKWGAQIEVLGVALNIGKAGTPNDLIITVYEGTTSKYSQTVPVGSIPTAGPSHFWFASPVLLSSGTNLYIILSQTGTSDSHDYDLRVNSFDATYKSAVLPTDWAFVYGTGDDPTALSVHTTEFPFLVPLVCDPAADFDEAAAGGGGGMQSGVMRGMAGRIG